MAHAFVTRISLIYLLSLPETLLSRAEARDQYPYSVYSAEHWPGHSHASDPERRLELETTLIRRLFVSPSLTTSLRVYNPDPFPDETLAPPLYYSSLLGFVNVTEWLSNTDPDVNAQGGGWGNALQAASFNGHEPVVRLLLDRGADVNAQGGGWGKALQAASANGHEPVVRLLLDRGADINPILRQRSADGVI